MPLEHIKTILAHATKHRYGVAAINTFNYETVKCIVKAAELEKMPVIVQLYPGFEPFIPMRFISYMALELARHATVPVAVHLDHSTTFDIAIRGIKDGFPSVMIDGSSLPYDENVSLTSAVVRTAKVFGVEVEAELGHVGFGSSIDDITNLERYTNVEQAVDFVQSTDCDLLAIAVGNAHGTYVQKPNLDFERIKAIRERLKVFLVLHGSSGIPNEQMRKAVDYGIVKFNIATEYFEAIYNSIYTQTADKRDGNAFDLMSAVESSAIEFARSKIRLLNPNQFSL